MQAAGMDFQRVHTPLGEFVLAARGDALTGGWFSDQARAVDLDDAGWQERDAGILRDARGQLKAYLRGSLRTFKLPLALGGTAFQAEVWRALAEIPWGETASYAQLAQRMGRPEAAHAVGAAVARNPLLIIIPCHRAIGSSGRLTGYAGGLPHKRWLLDLEGPQRALFDDGAGVVQR